MSSDKEYAHPWLDVFEASTFHAVTEVIELQNFKWWFNMSKSYSRWSNDTGGELKAATCLLR